MPSIHFQVVVNAIYTFGAADQTCPSNPTNAGVTVPVALYPAWRLY
jgi:hypothetical protein